MSSLSAASEDGAVASLDEELSPEDVIGRYKAMRNDIKKLTAKVDELEAEFNEHQLVISAISSMELSRKAFRLVGGVLIQQTVGEVLPAVTSHQAMVRSLPHTPQIHSFSLLCIIFKFTSCICIAYLLAVFQL